MNGFADLNPESIRIRMKLVLPDNLHNPSTLTSSVPS